MIYKNAIEEFQKLVEFARTSHATVERQRNADSVLTEAISRFQLLKGYLRIVPHDTLRFKSNGNRIFELTLVESQFYVRVDDNSSNSVVEKITQYQLIGVLGLGGKHKPFIIRPRTLADTLHSLFTFGIKKNSFRLNLFYQAEANHKSVVSEYLSKNNLKELLKTKGLYLEIFGNKLIVKFEKPVNLKNGKKLLEILHLLKKFESQVYAK